MKDFANDTKLAPGNITLTIKGGICEYQIYGYAITEEGENGDYIVLQPSDLRFNPVARIPKNRVASLTCKF